MNAIFFGILTILSLFIFMNLGKIKASKKQLNRNNRINWFRRSKQMKTIEENIIEGESHEVSENNEK